MTVVFHIEYRTERDVALCIAGLDERSLTGVQEMRREEGDCWTFRMEISPSVREIYYKYLLKKAGGVTIREPWKKPHHAIFDATQPATYHLFDCWRETPPDIPLYASAFTQVVFTHPLSGERSDETVDRMLVVRVMNPRVGRTQHVAMAGNQACLGYWQPEQAHAMTSVAPAEWELRLNADEITFPCEYKFLVRDHAEQSIRWETGENRLLAYLPPEKNATFVISACPFRENLSPWKGVGTVIPLFSLRSEQSFGIGDLHDLKLLTDWAAQTGQCLIQLLPLNDTTRTHTWKDSYPYSAISVHALHPAYISLPEMGALKDTEQAAFFRQMQQTLNAGAEVDYEAVEQGKLDYCRAFFEQEGGVVLLESEAFRSFLETARAWLIPYAAFCWYRDRYGTADFTLWGEHAVYNPERERRFCTADSEACPAVAFVCFLQFVLHNQFKAASEYAQQKGVILKGDLPIGVHRTSVDAWTETACFNMNDQAGAPPDVFSDKGQNWQFPTYNWEVMANDGFVWWKKRFRSLENYFTAFRIDHILGFFRIWEIPVGYVEGLCGHFRPALPFTPEEIESFGMKFRKTYARPRIHRRNLDTLFGDTAREAMETCLIPDGNEHWALHPCCDTQQKIDRIFDRRFDNHSVALRNGLFTVAEEVLFLPDPDNPDKYHPRIAATRSFVCGELTEEERQAFERLSYHFFYERHNDYWKQVALQRLSPLIDSTEMLICGEDLGMIPDSVHEVMQRLHILSLELERAPKTIETEFTDLQRLPYLSVCTTSTHDMSPLRSWWNEDRRRTERYFRSVLHGEGCTPETCSVELACQILSNHLHASSMLTIIPLQDWLALSDALRHPEPEHERIN
ncbi:MAG: 4-alpha-glucanotransferase, partial [Tannerella sp.]|nr:4-alpha-glucanotransferase [Tannerella sp.]